MLRLDHLGLVSGSSGNASIKLLTESNESSQQLYLVTPAGISYSDITTESMVVVNHDLETIESPHNHSPSSESLLHIAVYDARPDVTAVIHTHSVYASVQAVKAETIPPIIDEMIVYIGGQIEVSEYGFPGTPELAANSVAALGDRRAAIIRNHGMFAVADSLQEALRVAELVERVAKIYIHAKISGTIVEIPQHALEAERIMYLNRTGIRKP
jgi:L-fuculose-phosphate aldolase